MQTHCARKREWRERLWIGLLCGLLLLPTVAMPFSTKTDAQTENRTLSAFPSLSTKEGQWNHAFCTEMEQWFREHFAFRATFVNAYSWLTRTVFATAATPDVVIGNNGWLYYTDTMDDVTGASQLSDADETHLLRVFSMMNDYAATQHTQFMLTVAPNKASIYPEQLPIRYRMGSATNVLDQLTDAITGCAVPYCDLRMTLQQAKTADAPLYHALDTHWNNRGAMLADDALMDAMQHADGGLPALPYTMEQNWTGDLWTMLAPTQTRMDWNATYAMPQTFQYTGRFRGLDDLTIHTVSEHGTGSLWMVRDSFGRALIPLLAEQFADCTFTRATRIPLNELQSRTVDWFLFEIAERNLESVLLTAPQMPAPQVNIAVGKPEPNAAPLRICAEAGQSDCHLYGLYDAQFAACSAVYCTVSSDAALTTYEAFPCCEQEALGLAAPASNGFSLFLPLSSMPHDATFSISVQMEDGLVCVGEARYEDGQIVQS